MSAPSAIARFEAGRAAVEIYPDPESLGQAAARQAALLINRAISKRGKARIIAATGNSQIPFAAALVKQDVDWSSVEFFHMDEYVGLGDQHPASFRLWIRNRLENQVHPGKMYYLAGDAPDIEAEIQRYTALLQEEPIDLAFVGFGENGHIAFNDPHEADFDDPALVKQVTLDEACRQQQVGEGHFSGMDTVPSSALTVTCTGLYRAENWVSCVPDKRKAHAVQCSLEGPITTACPGSLAQRHPNTFVYLDKHSASLLSVPDKIGS